MEVTEPPGRDIFHVVDGIRRVELESPVYTDHWLYKTTRRHSSGSHLCYLLVRERSKISQGIKMVELNLLIPLNEIN
jgi:hypothetical protein